MPVTDKPIAEKPVTRSLFRYAPAGIVVAGLLLLANIAVPSMPSSAEEARMVPAATVDEPATTAGPAVAILAGGCFWGVQGVYQHVKGVSNAVSGYAGGAKATAKYQLVGSGTTGHAEAVRITYDPRVVTLGQLLQIYFSVAHDPTELNRQGPDVGTQYRSAIFPANDAQARVAKAYIAQIDQAHVFDAAIVTKIEPGKAFYPAEAYHQDFLVQNPTYPYIVYNDLPKVANLKRLFPDLYRAEPVLVATAGLSD
jgi:peptide-methionine (S)-S-oxide reductase